MRNKVNKLDSEIIANIRIAEKIFSNKYGADFLDWKSETSSKNVRTLFYTLIREIFEITDSEISIYFKKNRGQITAERNCFYSIMRCFPNIKIEYNAIKELLLEELTLPVWIIEN